MVRSNKSKLLEKAKESCLLAVDVYNKPMTSFRSAGYIVLMMIAWTSLFHAIFEGKTNYYYKIEDGSRIRYQKHDGEKVAWDISKCVKEYFKTKDKTYDSIRANLEFFIPLRNKIEHRFMPELDSFIFSECQPLLSNFETILTEEFGEDHTINENLVYSLQFSKVPSKLKESKPSKDFLRIKDQIMKYRASLPDEIFVNPNYAFKAALVQVNNPNKADYAIKFINIDDLDHEDREPLENALGIIKEKYTSVSDLDKFKSGDVAKKVQTQLSKHYGTKIKFNAANHHTKCCFEYKIRPKNGSKKKERTKKEFCIYNNVFDGYTYTSEWIKFLIRKLSNKDEFLRLFPHQKKEILGLLTATELSTKVKKELNKNYGFKIKFNNNHNLECTRHYGVRPALGKPVDKTDEKYCLYNGNNNYLYTSDWADFLIGKLSDKNEFLTIFPTQKDFFQ